MFSAPSICKICRPPLSPPPPVCISRTFKSFYILIFSFVCAHSLVSTVLFHVTAVERRSSGSVTTSSSHIFYIISLYQTFNRHIFLNRDLFVLYVRHLMHVCRIPPLWLFLTFPPSFYFPCRKILPQIKSRVLRTEDVVHCTDCKAHSGDVIVWFDLNIIIIRWCIFFIIYLPQTSAKVEPVFMKQTPDMICLKYRTCRFMTPTERLRDN